MSRDRRSVTSGDDGTEPPVGLEEGGDEGTATGSFWDVGNFKRCIKRMEQGIASYDTYAQMLKERAQVEAAHAHALSKWADKWQKYMGGEKTSEFGTLGNGFGSLFKQATEAAAVHTQVEQSLLQIVAKDLPEHKKAEYKKEFMTGYKEVKQAEKGFVKAQKPWAVLKAKVDKHQKAYHVACAARYKLAQSLQTASSDSNFSEEDKAKIRDKLAKAQKDEDAAKGKYEKALSEINGDNERYKKDMAAAYDVCEAKEKTRIDFYKGVLLMVHDHVAMVIKDTYVQTFEHMETTLRQIDSTEDAHSYSSQRGKDMGMDWPAFKEFNEADPLPSVDSTQQAARTPSVVGQEDDEFADDHKSLHRADSFEDKPRQQPPPAAAPPSGGRTVRALYDYEGQNVDELSFKEGDVIRLLQEDDGSGWATGSMRGRTGLLPANYVS
eukprot:comp22486_c0_seq1/m.33919 comp22486_c0_seq1/g.33919  ORF comp22486_c0_seq1/g.33919 comp22486_c0_seq1/m.33919 type:complete len:437 (-) comp22486_c0_seq1:89-1399(-)